jgi:hypothetical protein
MNGMLAPESFCTGPIFFKLGLCTIPESRSIPANSISFLSPEEDKYIWCEKHTKHPIIHNAIQCDAMNGLCVHTQV